MVPIDDSDNAAHALEWAVNNVVKDGDHLTVINIWPQVPGPATYGLITTDDWYENMEAKMREESHALLKKAGRKLGHPKFTLTLLSTHGDPRDELIAKVNALHVDLIVMGSRGHGALKRTLIGSVSDYVVHHASCPVTIVKPEKVGK
ncbi:hypothetical protein HDV00_004669 [Rhizophlyctis rosea]|nr:hypothetical protein HDV00_004669 [Rhizophlyctis rosea]